MTKCVRSRYFFKNRKSRRARVWRKMDVMRAAKARKRLADPIEREPKLVRFYSLQLGVRDKRNGDTAWTDFKSLRDAVRRLSVIQKFYSNVG